MDTALGESLRPERGAQREISGPSRGLSVRSHGACEAVSAAGAGCAGTRHACAQGSWRCCTWANDLNVVVGIWRYLNNTQPGWGPLVINGAKFPSFFILKF